MQHRPTYTPTSVVQYVVNYCSYYAPKYFLPQWGQTPLSARSKPQRYQTMPTLYESAPSQKCQTREKEQEQVLRACMHVCIWYQIHESILESVLFVWYADSILCKLARRMWCEDMLLQINTLTVSPKRPEPMRKHVDGQLKSEDDHEKDVHTR